MWTMCGIRSRRVSRSSDSGPCRRTYILVVLLDGALAVAWGGLRSLLNGLDHRLSDADADLDLFGARAATCSRVDVSVDRCREPKVAR